jgi:UDP-GlcNAc:undecaprenyl-phosphate GlcNAc-1-phosphate transferase
MINFVPLFLSSLLLSSLITPLWLRISARAGFFDFPQEGKIHAQPTPTMGGLVILITFFSCLWSYYFFMGELAGFNSSQLIGLTLAGTIIALLGIYDDTRGCNATKKLAIQLLAALVLYKFGFRIKEITNPFDNSIYLGFLKLPLTLLWVLLIINAINLIDGLDGLASGVILISALSFFCIALNNNEYPAALTTLILAGSILGFLRYNLPPAKVFLGDTGSMFLGLVIAAVSLLVNRKGTVTITLLLPIGALGFPIMDTIYAFFRRILKRKNPFQGDTSHLHHNLLHLGLDTWRTLLLIYLFCVYLGFSAYIVSLLPKQYALLILLILGIGIFLWLGALKYLQKNL